MKTKLVNRLILFWVTSSAFLLWSQSLPDLTFQNTAIEPEPIQVGADQQVDLSWTVRNASETSAGSANISIYLTRTAATPLPTTEEAEAGNHQHDLDPAGYWLHQETTGSLAAFSSKSFSLSLNLPRGLEEGRWYLWIWLDPRGYLQEGNNKNNFLAIPLDLPPSPQSLISLPFEGLPEGLIPPNHYAPLGVETLQANALIAKDAGGTGNFCTIHNGSATVGFMPRLTTSGTTASIFNFVNGFSDISMVYAKSPETQAGFRIWSGLNATGDMLHAEIFTPSPLNTATPPCSYQAWFDTGVIRVNGKSIEFFENDGAVNQSWFLIDNLAFTPASNDLVVHNEPMTPLEGVQGGQSFRVNMSDAIPAGKTIQIKLERLSPQGHGESLEIDGPDTLTFNASNWNIGQPLTIWAPENNLDHVNDEVQFVLKRIGGTSPQIVADRILLVTEIDDDFKMTVLVSAETPYGQAGPQLFEAPYDSNDDDWGSIQFEATPTFPFTHRLSHWEIDQSGSSHLTLAGITQNPTRILSLGLDAAGATEFTLTAYFEEIGTVGLTARTTGDGLIEVNSSPVGNNQTVQILPNDPAPLRAIAATGWVFSHWSSVPAGVIADPNNASTTITTSIDTEVTASFIAAPVQVAMRHQGNGSTEINQIAVGNNQSIQVGGGIAHTLRAIPDPEWQFAGWESVPAAIIADPQAAQTNFVTTSNSTITARFNFIGTPLTLSAGNHGSVDPLGTQQVTRGDTVEVTVLPEAGFAFQEWQILSGTPHIVPHPVLPETFLVTVNDASHIQAQFRELLPGKLVIRATNLQNPSEVIDIREPLSELQTLLFQKEPGGASNTFSLHFFNEGDLPLIIDSVSLANRDPSKPPLADSGFCLALSPDFAPGACALQQVLPSQPLPPLDAVDAPVLYLDFGRAPGFPDIAQAQPDYYGGVLQVSRPQGVPEPINLFQGRVGSGANISQVRLEKRIPGPAWSLPNGGVADLGAVDAGSMNQWLFRLTNLDQNRPFFAEKSISNRNNGQGIDPQAYGFFFATPDNLTVPADGFLDFSLQLHTKPQNQTEAPVTYTGDVILGTGQNLYSFRLIAVADGSGIAVTITEYDPNGVAELSDLLDQASHDLQPTAPATGASYRINVTNPHPHAAVTISHVSILPENSGENALRLDPVQSELPGIIEPQGQKHFTVMLDGNARSSPYRGQLTFDYQAVSGNRKTFEASLSGVIETAHLELHSLETQAAMRFGETLRLEPSEPNQSQIHRFEMRHRGSATDPALSGQLSLIDGGEFTLSSSDFFLLPGESHRFHVNFSGVTAGRIHDRLVIQSNDPVVNPFVLNLIGQTQASGAAPSQVPHFVARIGQQLLGTATPAFGTSPRIDFQWGAATSTAGIQDYHVILQPVGGPWYYSELFGPAARQGFIQTENLPLDVTYSVHIRARDSAGQWGRFTSGGSFHLQQAGPPSRVPNVAGFIDGAMLHQQTPVGLSILGRSPRIDFSWQPATSPVGIASYRLIVQPHGGPWLYNQVVSSSENEASIQTQDLALGQSYSIHMQAQDNDGIWGRFTHGGNFTIEESATPGMVPNFVARVGGIRLDGQTLHIPNPTIDFSWDPGQANAGIAEYQVVLKRSDESRWRYNRLLPASDLSHTLMTADLPYGYLYTTHIRSKDTLGVWGAFSPGGTFRLEEPGPPGKVPNFQGSIGGVPIAGTTTYQLNPLISFTWDPAPSGLALSHYQIVLKRTDQSSFLYQEQIPISPREFQLQVYGLEIGHTYSIHIKARDVSGRWGPFENGGSFTVAQGQAPSQVTGFLAFAQGRNADGQSIPFASPLLSFSWNHATSVVGIDEYQIVVQAADGSGWVHDPLIPGSETTFVLQTSGLVYDQSYSYHIRAKDLSGAWGVWQRGGQFTVVRPAPDRVPNFRARLDGNLLTGQIIQQTSPQIHLEWDHTGSLSGIHGYQIVLKTTDSGDWLYSAYINYPDEDYVLHTQGLPRNKSYTLHIRAKNNIGVWGPWEWFSAFIIQ